MTSKGPYTPPPGTFGLSRTAGWFGWLVAFAQLLVGSASQFTHAFIVLDDGTVLEANSKGSRIRPLDKRLTWTPIGWSWAVPLTDAERARIVSSARTMVNRPYSWLDYLSIGLLHLGLRDGPLGRFVLGRVKSSHRLICSQLVDECYRLADVHLFDDGRDAGDVMPSDLANLLYHPRWAERAA